jgi:xanthine dehydrogenase YagS FAD-binding subunit
LRQQSRYEEAFDMIPAFTYVRPNSVQEAVSALKGEGSHVLAGGSDLLGCLREDIFAANRLVSLSGLKKDLHGIATHSDGSVSIGALTTISEVSSDQVIRKRYPGLAQAASEVASPQLRNQGTLGGNLCQKPRCWYYRGEFHCLRKGGQRCYALGGEDVFHCIFGGQACFIVHPSDTAPVLAALGAKVSIAGPGGERTLPVSKLHVPPSEDPTRETVLDRDELITAIRLPRLGGSVVSSYRKIRTRRSWDFALAGAALVLDMDGPRVNSARVYLSGCAPIPWRSVEVEQAISGKTLTPEVIERAAGASVANARPLIQNGYKASLIKGVIREELTRVSSENG